MEQKLTCDTVRDLIPSYVEQMTSETTNRSIEEHLSTCTPCDKLVKEMKQDLHVPAASGPEAMEFKQAFKKTRNKIAMTCIGAAGILGILTCLLINFILDFAFTWSLIVTAGILFTEGICLLVFKSRRNTVRKLLIFITIAVFPLLSAIQFVSLLLEPNSGFWLFTTGFTSHLIWSAVLWITYFTSQAMKCNHFITAAIFFFITIPATLATNYIAEGYQTSRSFLISAGGNAVLLLLLGILCLFFGLRRSKSKTG